MVASLPHSVRGRRCFLDTSAYFALFNKSDERHGDASEIADLIAAERLASCTTNAVVFESHGLFLSRLVADAARAFLQNMESSPTTIVRVRAADENRARQIIFQYTDKDFSYTDALSFAVMERLRISRAFTFDRHFEQYGFTPLTGQ